MPVAGPLRGVVVDLAFWYCLPALFLIVYVGVLGQPAAAVLPHLLAMALPFAVQAMLRLVLSRWVTHARVRQIISSLVLALLVGAVLTYYVLVLISVNFWGSVVAWPAIPTFFRQAPDISEAVGVPRLAAYAAAAALIVAVFATCWSYLKRFDWTVNLGRSAWAKTLAAAAVCCALWLQVASATDAPWIAQAEPLSRSLFPLSGTRDIEGHQVTVEQARKLDAIEDRARAQYVPAGEGPRQNLILIVVDAMRPANMSLFGYQRGTTPYLDELARTAPLRKWIAHAPCSDTGCGLISLTSSKLPRDFSFRPFSLHETLRRNGYRIHVIQSGDHSYFHPMRDYYGGELDTWFDGNSVRTSSINDDQIIVDRLATMPEWDGKPAMFHFHLMSAHVTRKDDGQHTFAPAKSYLLAPQADETGADIELPTATNYYDNGVHGADAVIKQIVSVLREKGYMHQSLLVVTSDHGEALGEHGIFAHANSVREEVLKVPVVFLAEGYEPASFAADPGFALQIDTAPTILTELNIPIPATWQGRPLQTPYAPSVTFFQERDDSGLIDTRQPGQQWKYWIDRTWGTEFVYDLSVDPREAHNLLESVPEAMLSEWRRLVVYEKAR